jgi:hypothetical protein
MTFDAPTIIDDLKIFMLDVLLAEFFRNIRVRCTHLSSGESREKALLGLDEAEKKIKNILDGAGQGVFSELENHLSGLIGSVDGWSIGSYRGAIEELKNFCNFAEKETSIKVLLEKYGAVCSRTYRL